MPSTAHAVRSPRSPGGVLLGLLACWAACPDAPLSAQCELDKLLPAGVLPDDSTGAAVALFGSDMLIGRPGADLPGVGAEVGSVSVFARLDAGWVEQAPFVAPQGAAGDRFGDAMSLFSERAAVGAPGSDVGATDAGSVLVFERIGDDWSIVARLAAPEPSPGAGFGSAVCLFATTLVVGAPGADAAGLRGAGQAYVYERLDGVWTFVRTLQSPQPRAGGAFGHAVSLEADLIVVGAPGDDGLLAANVGAAYVYREDGGGWELVDTLHSAHAGPGDRFGSGVSHSASFVAVGAPGRDFGAPDAGAVSLFQKSFLSWYETNTFVAPEPEPGAALGTRVSLFKDLVAASAPSGSTAGEVHVYRRVPGAWVYALSVEASDAGERDGYGHGISLWNNGVLVGAPADDDLGADSGSAYLVQLFGETSWVDLVIGGTGEPDAMQLAGSGGLCGSNAVSFVLDGAAPGAPVSLVVGSAQLDLPVQGGLLVPRPDLVITGLVADAAGGLSLHVPVPTGVPTGLQLFVQAWVAERGGGMTGSNAILGLAP